MSLDDRTAQQHLTPEERRELLRAFADRMLLKVSAMDDPEDMPGVEKAVRVAAVIERIYYRCDRAEHQTPDPRKLEAERAVNKSAAIHARVVLASDLKWGEERRRDLGQWWDAADTATQTKIPAQILTPATAPEAPFVYRYDDDGVDEAVTPTPGDSDIGPVFDTLIDDLEALTDAIDTGKDIPPPLRSYPPAGTAPFSSSDDAGYAMTKATYDSLRMLYPLKPAGASP